jgi:hypothetical protein
MAHAHFAAVDATAHEVGVTWLEAEALTARAMLAGGEGDIDEAHRDLTRALQVLPGGATRTARRVVEECAVLASAQGHPRGALRLAGAAAAAKSHEWTLPSAWTALGERDYASRLAPAHAALSVEEATTTWSEGKAMSLDEALAYALRSEAPQRLGMPLPMVVSRHDGAQRQRR